MRISVSRLIFLSTAVLTLLLLAGCPRGKDASEAQKVEEEAGPEDTFVIALLPRENIFYQKRRYNSLAKYLSRALGMNVKTRLLDSYEAVYREMLTKKVDAALFGGLSYVVMDSKIDIEPIARPVHVDGRSTYRGVIFARRGRGITREVSTWRGKRIALVSESTTSGYLFPKWYLYKREVRKFRDYFGRVFYVGSHDATIRAVFEDKADIGCSTDRIFDKFLLRNPSARKNLIILAASGPFPSDTLGIKKGSLDTRREKLLKKALLHMDETDEGREVLSFMRIAGFMKTGESDYERVSAMMHDLSLEPDFFALGNIGLGRRGRQGGYR